MKKYLILSFVLLAMLSFGQTSVYRPFPTTYGNWVYQYFDDFGVPTSLYSNYVLFDDTIISSVTYKKISNGSYIGALRESSRRIYFIPDTSATEYLLYDFNLTIGDTIFSPFGGALCANDTVILTQIDSVIASDGYHRQMHWSPFGSVNWIEGIGSYFYLFAPNDIACLSGNYRLSCMVSDTTFIYPATSSSCILSVSSQDRPTLSISVVPNPSAGSFTVNFNKAEIIEIIITDLLGKIILHQRTGNQTQIKIDNLNSGAYFITAIDSSGRQTNKQIISSP